MNRAIFVSSIAVALTAILAVHETLGATTTSRKPKPDPTAGLNCTDHMQVIDKCATQATYSYTSILSPYPVTANEIKTSCDRIPEGLKCVKARGKCLGAFGRRSLTSYSNSRSRHWKKLCLNMDSPSTVSFMKLNECVKGAKKINLMVGNEKDLIATIQMLATNTTMKWESRFQNACCAALRFKGKVLKDINPECSKFKEAQEEMLDSMIGDLLETACPEATQLEAICLKLPKLPPIRDWTSGSLAGAALDLVVALSTDTKA